MDKNPCFIPTGPVAFTAHVLNETSGSFSRLITSSAKVNVIGSIQNNRIYREGAGIVSVFENK